MHFSSLLTSEAVKCPQSESLTRFPSHESGLSLLKQLWLPALTLPCWAESTQPQGASGFRLTFSREGCVSFLFDSRAAAEFGVGPVLNVASRPARIPDGVSGRTEGAHSPAPPTQGSPLPGFSLKPRINHVFVSCSTRRFDSLGIFPVVGVRCRGNRDDSLALILTEKQSSGRCDRSTNSSELW